MPPAAGLRAASSAPARVDPSEFSRTAKPTGDLAETRLVPVAQARTQKARRGGPRSAAKHAVRMKPGHRVTLVRICPEPRIRGEPAGSPLPDAGVRHGRDLQLVLGGQARPAP